MIFQPFSKAMGKKYLILLLLILSFSLTLKAQTIGGGLMLGLPQGEFKEKIDRLGYGIQAQGTLWSPGPDQPFTVGLNVGYMIYGEESDARPLSNTIGDVWVVVERQNSLVNFHLLFQVMPFEGSLRPYIEGLFGGAYIFTETSVQSQWYDEDIFTTVNFDDFTWSYGFGGGLKIKLTEDLEDFTSLYLDLNARYILGTEAEYLREGDIFVNQTNGNVTYLVSKSKTDLMTISVGVTAVFN